MVPRAVLLKSGLVSINTARQNILKTAVSVNTAKQVNTAHSKTTVNAARPMPYLSKTTHSTVKRPIHKNTAFKNSNIDQRVNIVSGKNVDIARPKVVVNVVQGNNVNVVKASACWVWKPKTKVLDHGNPQMDLQDKGVIDSGCSRYMTGNMSYIIDYKEIDGGYVAFGGNPKGGKITIKGTIKTGNLDFENICLLKMVSSAPNPSHNSNFSLLLVLGMERLTGPNYMDWVRNFRFTLRYENKEYVLDVQIPTINDDSTQEEIEAHQKHYDDANKVSCIMASSMSPELQKTFENTWAYEMNQHLKEMF
ncbi:hypothetical protein Tco_0189426 [Tanacetum coccineum]